MTGRTSNGRTAFLAVFAALYAAANIGAARAEDLPKRVLLIRHAEKPAADANSIHLSAEGKERADALYKLFQESQARPDPFPKPDFLFATKATKRSNRPAETLAPLVKKLKLPVDTGFGEEDAAKMVQEIRGNRKYAGKTVLISWHHGEIPNLAEKFGASDAPKHWPSTAFDRVWQIDFHDGKATLRDLPQRLMKGDSEK